MAGFSVLDVTELHERYQNSIMLKAKYLKRFAEFFIIGLVFGMVEDLIAIGAVSDVIVTPRVLGVVFLVALPFAIVSELVVDGADIFRHYQNQG